LGRPPIDPSGPWTTALVAVTVLGVVGTGIATFLFNKLVQDQGSLFATMTINLTPMGAFLWGWGMGETVTPVQMIALLGVLTMVIVVQFGAASSPNASARADAAIDEELVP
jgi:drug/metabolite transporter (DMT)-like permease